MTGKEFQSQGDVGIKVTVCGCTLLVLAHQFLFHPNSPRFESHQLWRKAAGQVQNSQLFNLFWFFFFKFHFLLNLRKFNVRALYIWFATNCSK